MTIELATSVAEELKLLATLQHRDIRVLIEEALRQYLEAAAITDLDSFAVGETQAKLVGELRDIAEWSDAPA